MTIKDLYWFLPDIRNRILLKYNKVTIGEHFHTYGNINIKIERDSIIRIGNNTIIRSSWRSNPAGGGQQKSQIVVLSGAKLIIGNNVGISNSTLFCQERITIEDDVLIGANCVIYDTDFHSVNYEYRINNNTNILHSPVHIKEGAWIGGHCIILKGITIGKHAVIGAGSIVTCNVPDNEIWAGNPAKYIKNIPEIY